MTSAVHGPRLRLAAALSVLVVGALAHANGLRGPFVFDDLPAIVDNSNARALVTPGGPDLARAAWAPPGTGASGRPLVALSLAADYARAATDDAGAPSPVPFRTTNAALHVLCALALLALVRAALERAGSPRANGIAWASALLFVAHPLATSAIQHVVYRGEILMAVFFLMTGLATLRAIEPGARRPRALAAAAVALALLGVLSKEPMFAAPIACLLLDRTFVSGTVAEAFRRHGRLHAALFATWIPLALLIAAGDRGESVGLAHADTLSPLDYLRTQAGVVLHYLRLVVWPHPLVLDHLGWPVARSPGAWLPQGVVVLALVAAAIRSTAQRQPWGLAVLTAFLVLAPSSSLVPLGGMIVGEHRAYLPLGLLLPVLVAAGGDALVRLPLSPRATRASAVLVVAALTAAGVVATRARNATYRSAVSIHADTVSKVPDNWRARTSLGVALRREGRTDEARAQYERALELAPNDDLALNNLANLELAEGRTGRAVDLLRRALATDPDRAELHYNLAAALARSGRPREALEGYARAAALAPDHARIRFAYGVALQAAGRLDEAAGEVRAAARLEPAWRAPQRRLRALEASDR